MLQKGNIFRCLESLKRLSDPFLPLVLMLGENHLKKRFSLISQQADLAIEKINKIRSLAQTNGYNDILSILDEELEFGPNIPTQEEFVAILTEGEKP